MACRHATRLGLAADSYDLGAVQQRLCLAMRCRHNSVLGMDTAQEADHLILDEFVLVTSNKDALSSGTEATSLNKLKFGSHRFAM